MVWAVTHFHSYLYGHSVTVLTDQAAVKAVLETPNPSGKHATNTGTPGPSISLSTSFPNRILLVWEPKGEPRTTPKMGRPKAEASEAGGSATATRRRILEENLSPVMGGHFSGKRMYTALVCHWWWDGMYADTLRFARNCPECAIVTGGGRPHRPPSHAIPVNRPFQIVGVDIMELPRTCEGNRYVLVCQDFLSKWRMAYAMPDQKAVCH